MLTHILNCAIIKCLFTYMIVFIHYGILTVFSTKNIMTSVV